MINHIWRTISAMILILFLQNIFAWSENGHKTIAWIAWDLLNKDAEDNPTGAGAKAVSKIQLILDSLGSGISLADIAICADQIRELALPAEHSMNVCKQFPIMPKSKPWHFINIPIHETPHGANDLEKYCSNQNCIMDQIRVNLHTLQTTKSNSAKQLALMFLVHFVGDLHQPLHCSTEITDGVSDRGGNGKSVNFTDKNHTNRMNLHALWDHMIQVYDDSNDPISLSQQLEAELPTDTSSWITGDFISNTILEGFNFAQHNIYPDYHNKGPDGETCQGNQLGRDYQILMIPIINQRIQMGGVRLVALLKQAFV